ncbi:ribonuclease P protein component [Candidatus Falkowbacteria bacterium CG11_big_fil_rev_8_21_14_0_20_39_10]|uniref:Ribonuclease P protein component n=1 Tax=Candidatus Falkowbacteria bacterium CG11_big_fil_rev_8_21_14_0_20_39_10 TaxID=1974570 RepID=A0A2M6K9G9_9BACT|nr:MAG: ribonuclease P protein component [Candidatus Falkowbacteria bacterium CG11_big_fil_rev_8_21_14_0_20_39_10]
MFAQKNRLTKDKEFENVFKNGRSSYDKIIGLKITKNGLDYSRFGVLVSNKISKKAVARNKIKRRVRAVIEKIGLDLKPGYDCVAITLAPILERTYQDMEKSLVKHFKKLKTLKQ